MFNDFKEAMTIFLKDNAIWLSMAVAAVILATILVFAILNFKNKNRE